MRAFQGIEQCALLKSVSQVDWCFYHHHHHQQQKLTIWHCPCQFSSSLFRSFSTQLVLFTTTSLDLLLFTVLTDCPPECQWQCCCQAELWAPLLFGFLLFFSGTVLLLLECRHGTVGTEVSSLSLSALFRFDAVHSGKSPAHCFRRQFGVPEKTALLLNCRRLALEIVPLLCFALLC